MNTTFMTKTAMTAALLGTLGVASAQDFPTKPVRILCTEPGGASDFSARIVAQGLTGRWGRQVIVENRPSLISIETLIKASPDGYTLLLYASGLWIGPLMQKSSYDPLKDLAPVTIATNAPAVLVVHPSVAAKSVKELIAIAKAKPGELNYASGGLGSTPHLAAELFKSMAGVNIVRVPYKGTGPAANAVMGGDVQTLFATLGTVGPHVKQGKLRPLAVTSAKPSALAPDLPTIASVLPGYELTQIQGMFAPVKTPVALIKRIQGDIAVVLGQQEVKDRFLAQGTEPIGSAPEVLAQAMKAEMARLDKVVKQGGIRQE